MWESDKKRGDMAKDYIEQFDDIYSWEKLRRVRYTVLYSWGSVYKIGDRLMFSSDAMVSLGTFDNVAEAYGHAILYLNNLISGDPKNLKPTAKISALYSLEAESGYGMSLEYDKDDIEWKDYSNIYNQPENTIYSRNVGFDTVYILVDKEWEEE
jgi:hypothetical protein